MLQLNLQRSNTAYRLYNLVNKKEADVLLLNEQNRSRSGSLASLQYEISIIGGCLLMDMAKT